MASYRANEDRVLGFYHGKRATGTRILWSQEWDCNSVAVFFVNASGHVWNTTTGNLKTTLVNLQYEYTRPAFLADNKPLALVDPAKTQVWDIRTGAVVMTSKGKRVLHTHRIDPDLGTHGQRIQAK